MPQVKWTRTYNALGFYILPNEPFLAVMDDFGNLVPSPVRRTIFLVKYWAPELVWRMPSWPFL